MPILSESSNLAHLSRRKIFAIPAGFSGCAWWRFRLPLSKLELLSSDLSINMAYNSEKNIRMTMEEVNKNAKDADVLHLQAPGHETAHTLIQLYQSQGCKVAVDFDDYSFNLHPGNPRFSELGTRECDVVDKDGKVVFRWRDGENGFDLASNIAKYEAFKQCVQSADMVTTTTDYLADKFRHLNPNVRILPNSVDFDLWKPLQRPEKFNDQVRIGWFGGDSHYADLKALNHSLLKLQQKHDRVRIVLQCPPVPEWGEVFNELAPERVDWTNWADLRFYTLFLAAKHWDIGLCPLEDNEFNKCKSNIKILEFAALKVPVVAQNMIPYSNYIRHGETGFLASTEDEWVEYVGKLVENDDLRHEMGQKAYEDAFEKFNLNKNCLLWKQAYFDLGDNHVGTSRCNGIGNRRRSGP